MQNSMNIFKRIAKIILIILIAVLVCGTLTPVVKFLSSIIAFGMGIGLGYVIVAWLEDNCKWFK